MIGKDKQDNEEERELKVTDKRKFNVDGSLREGVTIEKEPPKPTRTAVTEDAPTAGAAAAEQALEDAVSAESQQTERQKVSEPPSEAEEEDLLKDENPASFVNFLSTLVTNAAASLGAMPHPATGQKSVDLETGKYWIDVLSMLREKTDGNLSTQEQTLLESILSDLQMQYVALTRATEEKLKAQAAQKFSSKDILGG